MKKTEYEKRTAVYDIMNVSKELRKKSRKLCKLWKNKNRT